KWLHQTDPVLFGFQSFIDFQERDDTAVFPEECRHRFPFSLSIHCAFKQNRSDDLVAREGGRTHDAYAHLVHPLKHLGLSAIRAVRNTVVTQSTGRRTTTLIKRGDKALLGGHLRVHFVAGHFLFLGRPLTREVLFSRFWALLLKRSVSFVVLGDRTHPFHRLLLASTVNRSIAGKCPSDLPTHPEHAQYRRRTPWERTSSLVNTQRAGRKTYNARDGK